MMYRLIFILIRWTLSLRYRVRVHGLSNILKKGSEGILILPNHPGLIDPILLMAHLYGALQPRPLADAEQMKRPVIRRIAKGIRVLVIPDASKIGTSAQAVIHRALNEIGQALHEGSNVLLYPAGHLKSTAEEKLGGNSAVQTVLKSQPGTRVVLVRTQGLWGSRFSKAFRTDPQVMPVVWRSFVGLVFNLVFFFPRRNINIEMVEVEDFPSEGDRIEQNRLMEHFYNQSIERNTYLPWLWWQGGEQIHGEPARNRISGNLEDVLPATREVVITKLQAMTDHPDPQIGHKLDHDLGMDSLMRAELVLWIEQEFGFPQGNANSLESVGDVLLAASGQGGSSAAHLVPPPPTWFTTDSSNTTLEIQAGNTITEVFLSAARKWPDRLIIADQYSGTRTYRDLLIGILLLGDVIRRIPGPYAGILLPAGVPATTVYLATIFAGKVPVLLNFTGGQRNLHHAINLLDLRGIISAQAMVNRLADQGTDLSRMSDRMYYLETLARDTKRLDKTVAWFRVRTGLHNLAGCQPASTAAVLFTSGSESLPKAVPLSHQNLLTNLRDTIPNMQLTADDRLLGILPPFHSFGLTGTVLAPLLTGLSVAYHPNPTEAATLSSMVKTYAATMMFSTPTFLKNILRAAEDGQLDTLRRVFTGAEKCPETLFRQVSQSLPHLTVLEGYGITECAPVVAMNTDENNKRGSIGRPVPSLNHVLVSTEGDAKTVPLGSPGMLLLRGPSIMDGYLAFDGKTPFVTWEGQDWYKTGDLVTEDSDGFLTFVGRMKRFVKIGGEMISLPAIESVLEEHYVTEEDEGPVLAVGANDNTSELILFTIGNIDRNEANNHLRDAGLSALHNIRRVTQLKTIPILGTGKIDYRALKAMIDP